MTLTHEQRRRRRLIRSWIPAALLLVISIAAITVAVVASSTGVGAAPTAAPTNAVTAKGTSLFTPAGLRYIADSRKVFIDATARPILAKPLGLAATGTLTVAPPTEGVYEYLSVVGPRGGMRFMGTSIDITTRGDAVRSAAIADSNRVLTYRNTLAFLRARAARYGIPASQLDGLGQAGDTAARNGTPYRYSIHTDDALGLALTVTASCSSDSDCMVVDVLGFD